RSGMVKSWCDVAVIDEGLWRELILVAGRKRNVTLPPGIPGSTPEERLNHYIHDLREGIELLFPSDSLRYALTRASDTEDILLQFLRNTSRLDINWGDADDDRRSQDDNEDRRRDPTD
ncbi:MAG: hypothetical protein GY767_18125, partial [Shimia sp.]|nr:hypothetical protein [Shimia sp.]